MSQKKLVYGALIEARTAEAPYFQLVAFTVQNETDLAREKLWPRLDEWLHARQAHLLDIVDDEVFPPDDPANIPPEIASGDVDVAAISGRMFHGKRPSWLQRAWRALFAK